MKYIELIKGRLSGNWPLVLSILLATFYLLPFLLFPALNLIDDGWNLQIADKLTQTPIWQWQQYLVETHIGRLRPVYYLYFYLLYVLSGTNPLLYWIAQAVVLSATLFMIYKLLFLITKNKWVSGLTLFLPLLYTTTADNLYRLGTQEPKQFLFQLLFIYWAIKLGSKLTLKSAAVGVGLLLLSLGSKETSLILLPLLGLIYVSQLILGKWRSWNHLILVAVLGVTGTVFYFLIPTAQNYTLGYSFSPSNLIFTAMQMRLTQINIFWVLGVAMCFTAVRIFFFSKSLAITQLLRANLWQMIIGAATTLSFLIILPWSLQLERYYYNVTFLALMYVGIEAARWWEIRHQVLKCNYWQKFAFTVASVVLIGGMTTSIFGQQIIRPKLLLIGTYASLVSNFSGYQNSYALIKVLLRETLPNDQVYVAYNDYEIIYDAGQFAALFGNRPVPIFNMNQTMVDDFGPPYFYLEDVYTAYEAAPSPKILIDKASSPELQAVSPAAVTLKPRVTFFNEAKDLWGIVIQR